jgi:hypothetical protein
MRSQTHFLGGISALWLLTPLPFGLFSLDYGALAISAGFGALLPDLDAAEPKIKHLRIPRVKPFELAASTPHQTFRHYYHKGTWIDEESAIAPHLVIARISSHSCMGMYHDA